ncbi:MAG TPA: TnsA endonuclease N-terminal domain-containing protein [Azospirillum sp.]|nr:TnsA endonuclease N-terminal domain-containing protein [Azospirillum sp.]
MARSRYGFTEDKIARFYKEGRGSGRGAAYKPWLTVRDVPSSGRSHRPLGLKTGRVHHLLSDIERDLFLLLDWSDAVGDIREQFPLDRSTTMRIAEEIGVPHPVDRQSKAPLVMTTDFVVDLIQEGQLLQVARAVKPAEKLDEPRTVAKLEIERRYWTDRGVDWGIVTERDIPETLVRNIENIHAWAVIDDLTQPYPGFYAEKAALIAREVSARAHVTMQRFCEEMDLRLSLDRGACLMLLRHLLVTKVLACDLSDPVDDQVLMSRFRLAAPKTGRVSA